MATYLKELIEIPEKIHKGDFVLSLADGVSKPEQTLHDYVVTAQLQSCFREALSFVKSALEANVSKMTYLHGSFGSGKSHFMAVLDLILANHPAARGKKDLQQVCQDHLWTENHRLLMVPYHMIGAQSMEQAILGGYARYVKQLHPEAPTPAVYLADGLFADADNLRQNMGDPKFFQMLNAGESGDDDGYGYDVGWDPESYQAAKSAPAGHDDRSRLVSDLVTYVFKQYAHVTSGKADAYLNLDQGLAEMSRHAKSLGYDGVILFLDELILWLASRAADIKFVHTEGQKLAKLVEAQEAHRPVPIVSFVARQRDLRDLIGENVTGVEELNFDDAFRHWGGRFHTLTLEDVNLPDIVEGRVLKPRSESAKDEINQAFDKMARGLRDEMEVLLTHQGTPEMFRKVYPFSPALVETLVAASALLQRNRTAIKALVELLVEQREQLTLGTLIPVGDLFDIVSHGDEVFSHGLKEHFDNAKRLYHEKFRPMLEADHQISEEKALAVTAEEPEEDQKAARRYRNDSRLVKTLLLSALVPGVESFRVLTPKKLAALNHGTIASPIPGREGATVLNKLQKWAAQVGELRLSEGDNPTVSLQLVGIDTDRILEYSRHMDNTGNRKRKIRELVAKMTEIKQQDLINHHSILWLGTTREFPVEFANVREKTLDSMRVTSDSWSVLIDFPFDEENFGPRDDLGRLDEFRARGENSRLLVWLPQFLSQKVLGQLGHLIKLEHVLVGDNFKEATKHLPPQDGPQARTLLENQKVALSRRMEAYLEMAYGVRPATDDVINQAVMLEPNEQLQSLWAGFSPRPPVGANFKEALTDVLAQVLAHDYPGHPNFEVDTKITTSTLKTVWKELCRLHESGQERMEIEKTDRHRLRSIAQPLKLGQMAETHFVAGRHWVEDFDRKMHRDQLLEPSVRDLDRWIDDPKPTGLPNELRDLVILWFAARTNRSFQLRGVPYSPEVGRLDREARLVVQALPSSEDWSRARQIVESVFDISFGELLNADTVARFAGEVSSAASTHAAAVEALPQVLVEKLRKLGLDPEQSERLRDAQQARRLVQLTTQFKTAKELVEALAGLKLSATLPELATSVKKAESLLRVLREKQLEVMDLLSREAGSEAQAVRSALEEAFLAHEFAKPLGRVLQECDNKAWSLLKEKPPSGAASTIATPAVAAPAAARVSLEVTPPSPQAELVSERTLHGVTGHEALRQLQAALTDGCKVDISWKVWTE